MKKVLTVLGARPQFIKASIVSKEFQKYDSKVEEIILHTGQHYDSEMSDIFFHELGLSKPRYNLGIGGGTHGENTGRMIEGIEGVLLDETPDVVLVYGDTDSTLAAAIASSKLNTPIAHVESGLRSRNREMPEEINRLLTDHASDFLFTPTDNASKNLRSEGISSERIYQVGDVMFDLAKKYSSISDRESTILEDLRLTSGEYVLVTVHRKSNTGNPKRFKAIFEGLSEIPFEKVFPMHPRTLKYINEHDIALENTQIIEPVGFLDMMKLERNARLIATDSGGVQKEAFFHKVPCITLRDETEWVETFSGGYNRLAGADPTRIRDAWKEVLAHDLGPLEQNPFGDGNSADKIVKLIIK